MYLTPEEEKTLNGEYGESLQKAIEILVALGDIYGADKLIPVKSAQIAGVSYKTIGDAGLGWISDLEGKVKIPSILNPAGMDIVRWDEMGIDPIFAKKQQEIIEAYAKLGIQTKCTCTPYYLEGFNVTLDDHIAWSESSAVSYANSVIGARTNREGGPSALSAALVGKTANYGYHLDEMREPVVAVEVDCELSGSDLGALGYVVGKTVGSRVPIFYMKNEPSKNEMKALGAALAASGAVALYHIEGVTPEATRKTFTRPDEVIPVERTQIDEVYETNKDILSSEIITVGCPHCSVEELEEIAGLVEGKKLQKEMWVCTAREVAERHPDLVQKIEKSGAKVVCDTCMVVSPATNKYASITVNSGKALAYVPSMCKVAAKYASIEDCINEAGVVDEN
ncbi:MAG: mevalonate 5-phosphate dehydratase large subunit [Methanolobus sp.]|jgi:predicted aconitase|uniref:aconitase X catalytic domain-containing protein n=1 Tax=Methanolobus sp. TaxID=1874737 RepID=UPI0024AC6334|nr:aconitase X catalytic domain-containing protein [Methanolobus sp.]MDI3486208.1 mevalonate 5-phosphate dehydratase large subunit [Methanolobus sp.]MDK2832910.1 mevalonate 5-phosphate dehydratase large subunit [Methanolobus sp.]MDK2939106.1 mevalonate 5-phosphate dehydratase large subunit [Methanolobus sp.]